MKKIKLIVLPLLAIILIAAGSNHVCNTNKKVKCSVSNSSIRVLWGGTYTPPQLKPGSTGCDSTESGINHIVNHHTLTEDANNSVNVRELGTYTCKASCSECGEITWDVEVYARTYTATIKHTLNSVDDSTEDALINSSLSYTVEVVDEFGETPSEGTYVWTAEDESIITDSGEPTITIDTSKAIDGVNLTCEFFHYNNSSEMSDASVSTLVTVLEPLLGTIRIKSISCDQYTEVEDNDGDENTLLFIGMKKKDVEAMVEVTLEEVAGNPIGTASISSMSATDPTVIPPDFVFEGGNATDDDLIRSQSLNSAQKTEFKASCGGVQKKVTLISLEVEQFKDIKFTNSYGVQKDDGTDYTPALDSPIAFSKNTNYNVEIRSSLNPMIPENCAMDQIALTATLQGVGDEKSIGCDKVVGQVDEKGFLKFTLTASKAFPNTVKYYENFNIDWNLGYPESSTFNKKLCSSSNPTYIINRSDAPKKTQRTLYHIACENADGLSGDDLIFEAIWGYLEKKTTTTFDDKPLYYYGIKPNLSDGEKSKVETFGVAYHHNSGSTDQYFQLYHSLARHHEVASTEKLLKIHDGKCGAWAHFMADILMIHKIETKFVTVSINETMVKHYVKDPSDLQGGWVLVEEIPKQETPQEPKAYFAIERDAEGQGGVPRENVFADHIVVLYNNHYYDPSYGNTNAKSRDLICVALADYLPMGWSAVKWQNTINAKATYRRLFLSTDEGRAYRLNVSNPK